MCGYIWAFDRYGFCDWFLRRNRFSKRNSTYNKQTIKLTQTPQHPYSNTWNWEFVMSKESPVCLLARSPSSTIIYIFCALLYLFIFSALLIQFYSHRTKIQMRFLASLTSCSCWLCPSVYECVFSWPLLIMHLLRIPSSFTNNIELFPYAASL